MAAKEAEEASQATPVGSMRSPMGGFLGGVKELMSFKKTSSAVSASRAGSMFNRSSTAADPEREPPEAEDGREREEEEARARAEWSCPLLSRVRLCHDWACAVDFSSHQAPARRVLWCLPSAEQGKRPRWLSLLSGKKETKVVPLMVSSKPVHTVSAMKKRSAVSRKHIGEPSGWDGGDGGGDAPPPDPSSPAAQVPAAWSAGPAAALKSRKSGKVVWTIPGEDPDDEGAAEFLWGPSSAAPQTREGRDAGPSTDGSGPAAGLEQQHAPTEGGKRASGDVPHEPAPPPGLM